MAACLYVNPPCSNVNKVLLQYLFVILKHKLLATVYASILKFLTVKLMLCGPLQLAANRGVARLTLMVGHTFHHTIYLYCYNGMLVHMWIYLWVF